LLRSYAGASRMARNWVLDQVKANLDTRQAERGRGVAAADLTKSLSWHPFTFTPLWTEMKNEVAPWNRNVSAHTVVSGISNTAGALTNWSNSNNGRRAGARMGFAKYQSRRSRLSVTFVDLKHQLGWLADDRHHVRLILPRFADVPAITRHRHALGWIYTTQSTRRLYNLVRDERARIQKVTISFTGGRWQASFLVRYLMTPVPKPMKRLGDVVGVDLGVKHLATLSRPVPDLTDCDGHIANPRHLEQILVRLADLDRRIARCQKDSKNRRKLILRRARLYGRMRKTRDLGLHRLTTRLAGSFDVVVLEDLDVKEMTARGKGNHSSMRRSVLNASFYEPRRKLTYKTSDRAASWSSSVGGTHPRNFVRRVARREPSSHLANGSSSAVVATCVWTETSTPVATLNTRVEGSSILPSPRTPGRLETLTRGERRPRLLRHSRHPPLPEQNHAASKPWSNSWKGCWQRRLRRVR
jgi:putative transposase